MTPYDRYIELMKCVLLDSIYEREGDPTLDGGKFSQRRREGGYDWPSRAHTMVGRKRLDNVQACIESVLRDRVPGDVMETGVWRGGATILMRAVLEANGDTERRVWVADSFQGLPKPNEQYPADAGDRHFDESALAVSVEQVQENFARYGLLDDRIVFLKGWFSDTLPSCSVEQLAVLRLDGDMYESTYVALDALYHRLSPGGFLIVDDYGAVLGCRTAITDFRAKHGIDEAILPIDWTGVYWQKKA